LKSACLIKYPPLIEKGSSVLKLICSIDLLPTLSNLTGVSLPNNEIDGQNITPIILGDEKATNPQEYYAISKSNKFESVISGDGQWKLHIPHGYHTIIEGGINGKAGDQENRKIDLSLINLKDDPYAKTNVAYKHPDIVLQLKAIAEKHKTKFYTKKEKS